MNNIHVSAVCVDDEADVEIYDLLIIPDRDSFIDAMKPEQVLWMHDRRRETIDILCKVEEVLRIGVANQMTWM